MTVFYCLVGFFTLIKLIENLYGAELWSEEWCSSDSERHISSKIKQPSCISHQYLFSIFHHHYPHDSCTFFRVIFINRRVSHFVKSKTINKNNLSIQFHSLSWLLLHKSICLSADEKVNSSRGLGWIVNLYLLSLV